MTIQNIKSMNSAHSVKIVIKSSCPPRLDGESRREPKDKNCVLWWGPDRQVGALWIAIFMRGETDFIYFYRSGAGLLVTFLTDRKVTRKFYVFGKQFRAINSAP
jgi:hypothetical protein